MSSNSRFKFIDNLSIKPELKVNGDARFHTSLSIMLSFLTAIGIVGISCIFMNEWLSKKKINLIYNLDIRKYSTISFEGKNIGLIVTDLLGDEIADYARVMNIKFKYVQVVMPPAETNNPNNTKPVVTTLDVRANDCKTYEKINPIFAPTNKNYKNTVCLDFEKNIITFTGKFGAIQG